MAIIRYYTLDTTTRDLAPLALPVVIDGKQRLHPSPAQAAALGAYTRNDNAPAPTPPEGKVAIPDSWEVRDGEWVRTYTYEDAPPPPPRRWSRLSIETALAQADMLDAADAYLAQVSIVGTLTAARAFSRCDYIEEGYGGAEKWNSLLDGAAQALGKSRAEIDAFLDALPTEGV